MNFRTNKSGTETNRTEPAPSCSERRRAGAWVLHDLPRDEALTYCCPAGQPRFGIARSELECRGRRPKPVPPGDSRTEKIDGEIGRVRGVHGGMPARFLLLAPLDAVRVILAQGPRYPSLRHSKFFTDDPRRESD